MDERTRKKPTEHETRIKRQFFEDIKAGRKTLELRIGFRHFNTINVGDHITFKSSTNEEVRVIVDEITKFGSVEEVLANIDLNKLLPDATLEEAQKIAQEIFKPADVKRLGLLLFSFHRVV